MKYIPTVKSYFSGAGGMDLGLKESGVNIIQSLEIDKICIETLKANFNHKIIHSDIKNITVLDQDKSDIMVGTFPCNKYSTIADIHQTRTGDDLFLHFFRHVALEQPEMYIVENVPGMKKFKVTMEALTKLKDYFVWIGIVNANIWLPQNRPRLIIIGSKHIFNWTIPEQNNALTLRDLLEHDPEIDIPDCVYSRLNGKYRDKPIISDPEKGDIAPLCVAHYSKDRGTRLVIDKYSKKKIRPYTVKEYARLQGFPDSFLFSGTDCQQYKQIGNSVANPVGRWVGNEARRYYKFHFSNGYGLQCTA